MSTDGWYVPALENFAPVDGGSHLGPVTIGVLHTTESTTFRPQANSYYGHSSFPHFTCAVVTIGGFRTFHVWQHISIRKAGRALKNLSGGVQTNREGCIQIEVVGRAVNPFTDDPVVVEGMRKLMRWIEQETDIAPSSAVTFHPYPSSYGNGMKQRLSFDQWRNYSGWLGHQHVPENSHGDPGAIDIGLLLGGLPSFGSLRLPPTPTSAQENRDMTFVFNNKGITYLRDGGDTIPIPHWSDAEKFIAKGAVDLTDLSDEMTALLVAASD